MAPMASERRVTATAVDAPGESLGRKVRRGAAWSTAEVAVARFGQFAQGIVVARLLAPNDFGVFAVALVVHSIVVNVSELGVSAALIRDDEATARKGAPTVATIALVASGVIAALMMLLAPLLSGSLGSRDAAGAVAVMALTLPLAGIAAVPSAFIRRDFRMDRLFVASALNMVATAIVVILLALAGWGPMALAWSWVAGQLATSVILLTYKPGRVFPGWDRAEAGRLLRFGLPLAGANILAFTVLNVDYIVVGRVLGAEALGLYVLAFNISGWPMNVFGAVVRSVSLPGFSHLQRDGASMSESFPRAIGIVATLTLPVCAILGALAVPLVNAVYGSRWSGAAAALVGLSALGAVRILIELTADFLVTLGRTRAVFVAQIPWLLGLTAALLVLVHGHGIAGAGFAQALVSVGLMTPIYLVLLHRVGVSMLAVARAVVPPLIWALIAAGVALLVAHQIANPLLAVLAGGFCGTMLYVVAHLGDLARALPALRSAGEDIEPVDEDEGLEPIVTGPAGSIVGLDAPSGVEAADLDPDANGLDGTGEVTS
jgi:O-antigen/teichoic acid export membrane protein